MKQAFVILAVCILLGIVVFVQRHSIRSAVTSPPVSQILHLPTPTPVAPSENIYLTQTDAKKGEHLKDFQELTLYTHDKDASGMSTCYNDCVNTWPIYTSGATTQSQFPPNISVITRTDGTKQFAWKDMPLYYYAGDIKVGDINGDGVDGVWHIVRPQ